MPADQDPEIAQRLSELSRINSLMTRNEAAGRSSEDTRMVEWRERRNELVDELAQLGHSVPRSYTD